MSRSVRFRRAAKSATTLAADAIEGCIVARNPLFTAGRGSTALATPLPAAAQDIAMRLRYSKGYTLFTAAAEDASNQVTLVCALDLLSRNDDADVTRFLKRYLTHPSADVASAARQLYDRRPPVAN